MPRKIWGFEVKSLGWENEDGGAFDPDAVYPVLDVIGNRVYTIDKSDESSVSVFHSYGIKTQPGAALSISTMIWGRPSRWERPDISSRVVSCLGAPACYSCIELGQNVTVALANDWRLDPMNDSDVQLDARQLLNPGDPITEQLAEQHTMARLDTFDDSNQKELFRRAIALFGPPYDSSMTSLADPMIMALNLLPPELDPRADAEQDRLERIYGQDIAGKLARGWGM